MKKRTNHQSAEMPRETKKHGRRMPLLLCLALLLSFAPARAFQHPASAESGPARVLNCTAEPPKGEACADFFIHVHNEDCFDTRGHLVCPLPEIEAHRHTEDCVTTTRKLICTIPESDEHQHDESCYETVTERTCGKREAWPHTHTEDCYEKNEDGSIRLDGEGKPKLICGQVQVLEHVHGPECFTVRDPDEAEWAGTEETIFFTTGADEDERPEGDAPADADTEEDEEGRFYFLFPEDGDGEEPAESEHEAGNGGLIFLFPEEDEEENAPSAPEEEQESARPEEAEATDPEAVDAEPAGADPADTEHTGTEPADTETTNTDETVEAAAEAAREDTAAEPEEDTEEDAAPADAPAEEEHAGAPADVPMPAQEFSGQTDEVLVLVTAPEGAFPEGTTMRVTMVEVEADTMSSVEEAVEGKVTVVQALDISFFDAEGNKIEPLKPIQVSMKSAVVSESENVSLIHKPDADDAAGEKAEAPALEVLEAAVVEQGDASVPSDEITFESDAFSVYLLVGTTIEKTITASDGNTYSVSVTYGADAQIPADAALAVEEILPPESSETEGETDGGTDGVKEAAQVFETYMTRTAAALGIEEGSVDYIRLFDIRIVRNEEKIEIAAPVEVKITLADAESSDLSVVHFADGEESGDIVAGVNLDGQTVSFEAEGFSVYSIVSSGATANLDGQSFAIINAYTDNAIQGEAQNDGKRLAAEKVSFREEGPYAKANAEIMVWTFTAVGNDRYYIQASDGTYLNIEGSNGADGAVRLSETEQVLTVTAGTGNRAGQIRITNANGLAVNNYGGSTGNGFGPYSDSGNNEWFTLYDLVDLNPPYAAEKISVQALEDAQRVIIYKSVFNENTETYEDYVIDGNGNLVKAYDKSDQLTGYSEVSPVWVVTLHRDETTEELNGYYDFYNLETGMYLSPQSDGSLVSAERPGVTLNGRRDGVYNSTIEKWDESAWAWYGFRIGIDEVGDIALTSGTGEASQDFSFAACISQTDAELHPVATVDSASAGITIRMYDFGSRGQITGIVGGDTYREGNWYNNSGRASMTLQNGYPYFEATKKNASELFTGDTYKGDANHLFLESVYRSTGYYEYNAFNNFAHYDQKTGQFIVYQETGTPSNENKYFYQRGNFYPYNSLDVTRKATNTNRYDGSGEELDLADPTESGTLYLVNDANQYFGMTMEFSFMQPKSGYNNGGPMIYEFNGDDDLWVYIDGVKILDIGGVHDALPGSINFATGEITYGSNMTSAEIPRTVRACFEKAGVFPDGTAWNNDRAGEYFRGETFVDYGSHRFNMFYMEHGAGASNLEMRFNLPVIEKGKFTVEKVLDGTSQQKFANVYFAFQAFQLDDNGDNIPLTRAVYAGTTTAVPFYDSVQINGKTYTDVFYLKPGEAATFAEMVEDTAYYVQELGVGTDYYDEIIVNDVRIDGLEATEKDGIYPTSVATVGNRARVTYSNHCSEKNLNELRITKQLAEGSPDDGATFEFRVLLENADGRLAPYSTGAYYLQNASGDYFRYVDGKLTNNGKTPVVASVAGNNGTIAGIPAGYTVVIKDLLAGTDFHVEEIRLPGGWNLKSKTVAEDSCDAPETQGTDFNGNTVTADGRIRLDTDAVEIFVNEGSRRLTARKLWKPDDNRKGPVSEHGDIQVALYQKGEDDTLSLVEGSVRTIAAPDTSVSYALPSLADYVVREVTVEGDAVTMKEEGDLIAVSRATKTRGAAETDLYVVSYETGEVETQVTRGSTAVQQRTDTITNTGLQLNVRKTDINSGKNLPGAVFTLLREDGKTAVAGYKEITSSDVKGGNLLNGVSLSSGIYYLKETQAPDGYAMLDRMVKITVDEKGIRAEYDDGEEIPNETEGKAEQKTTLTISIPNTPGIEMPETGGTGASAFTVIGGIMTALAGAILTLKRRKEQA